jgi:anti-anti-sigma factor
MQTTATPPLLEVEVIGEVVVGRFVRRTILDPDTIELVGDRLRAMLQESGCRKIVLNFARVESLTSAMIGKFIVLHRDVDVVGGQLAFCGIDAFLAQIFALCGLPGQIQVFADESSALAALNPAPAQEGAGGDTES